MTAEAIDYAADLLPITIPAQRATPATVTPIRGDLRKAAERFVAREQSKAAAARQAALFEAVTPNMTPSPRNAARRLVKAYGSLVGAAEAAGVTDTTLHRVLGGKPYVRTDIAAAIVAAVDALPSSGDRFVEDVEDMVAAGESLHGIAARLGITPESVLRQLGADRHNRPDLAARLTLDDEPLPVPRRDLGKVGAATAEHADVPAHTAAAAARVVARHAGPDTDLVAAMLGIRGALPARTGRV